ncbi:rCG50800 [Rattus norvegicus]|uniref:RCG50800 n=1 Tax=Rattus norvegicus TaxID=10116 RepID=A6KCP4_RAT|nr:rCG50800 [Rattus norvegicus]
MTFLPQLSHFRSPTSGRLTSLAVSSGLSDSCWFVFDVCCGTELLTKKD